MTEHGDRTRAIAVLLDLAEDPMVEDELRIQAASTIVLSSANPYSAADEARIEQLADELVVPEEIKD
jgi:hypothetical protein